MDKEGVTDTPNILLLVNMALVNVQNEMNGVGALSIYGVPFWPHNPLISRGTACMPPLHSSTIHLGKLYIKIA
jgi:hypothetical protein